MAFPIIAPKLGWGTEPLELVEWKAKEGSWIEKGTSILTITTKKITSDIIAEHSGYLHISVEEEREAPIGSIVGFVAETKEELEKLQKELPKPTTPKVVEPEKIRQSGLTTVQANKIKEREHLLISPAARKLAEEHMIDISSILGTGPGGSIVREDIEKTITAQEQPKADFPIFPSKMVKSTIPLKGMRKVIAEHMRQSLSVSAQLTVMGEIDMTETVKARQALLKKSESIGGRITYTAIFVFIIAKLLKKYPIINASLIENEIKLWEDINVGVAVALEEGLIVPVIKGADKKSLAEISQTLTSLIEKAKVGQLVLDDATGGTFTITNLGALGGGYRFETVIINQPESAILGTGGITDRAVVRDRKIMIRPIMTYYFTYDHRVINGAVAAQFIADLTNLLEKSERQLFEDGPIQEIGGSKTRSKDVNGAKSSELSRSEGKQKDLISHLNEIVGTRITTSDFDRWFYSNDLLPIPNWIRRLFRTMPIAVVKPETAHEISAILSYCSQHKVPVVARGGGSAGVFSAVPKKGGIVLDVTDLNQVSNVDAERLQVTTAAGITWWELDKRLKSYGLAVKSYPSSARSATIGGWIMSSGLGIGSLKYGTVFEQILSAEIVLADGSIKEYKRDQGLEWFFETEGILGILTRVTLEVRRLPESMSHHVIYFDKIKNLFDCLPTLVNTMPCPYDIEILDYNYLNLLKASGFETTDFSSGSGTLLITYEGKRKETASGTNVIKNIAPLFRGEERENGDREWRHRFNMLRVRRAVPTMIPTSVRIPLTALDKFYLRLEKLKKSSICLLGHTISKNECMLIPMVVTDERRTLEYTFALHMPREISNLALSVGGKPSGGLGVWNAPYYRQMLSSKRVEEIRNNKRKLDPKGILNPGMWLEPPLLFKPRIYQLAMVNVSILDKIMPTRTVGKGN